MVRSSGEGTLCITDVGPIIVSNRIFLPLHSLSAVSVCQRRSQATHEAEDVLEPCPFFSLLIQVLRRRPTVGRMYVQGINPVTFRLAEFPLAFSFA